MLGNFSCFCCPLLIFFKITLFKENSGTLSVSKGLDPDQNRQSVCHDLGPNCLQSLSADDKCHRFEVFQVFWGRRWMITPEADMRS